jgi:ATP-binding cassette, subfamily C, bacterial CydD
MQTASNQIKPKPLKWLIGQVGSARLWIALSIILGVASGLLLIIQARCVARIIHATVMDGLHPNDQWPLFAIVLILIGARAALGWGRERAGFEAGARVCEEIRMTLVKRISLLGPAYVARCKTGALASTVMEHVEGLHGFFAHYLPQLALSVAIPVAILAFVFPISWAAGGILLFTAPLIPLFMILVGMGAESISQRHFQALGRMSAHFFDMLQGMQTLKLLNRCREEEAKVAEISDGYRKKTMSVLRVAFLSSAVLEFFSSISIAIVAMYLGMSYLGYLEFGAWEKFLTLESGIFILLLAPDFYFPLRELGTHYHARAEAVGAAEEILKVLSTEIHHPKTESFTCPGSVNIRCEDLHLTYDDGIRRALNGVSFDLKPGEQVALVGASGAGKTSVVNLLLGFVQADRGRIFINDRLLEGVSPESWRRHLAWIGQNPVLLHGSVLDNIRMGRPEASMSDIAAAAEAAGVLKFTEKLPDGLDTRVGEQGYGLSRGQAQRVALARAFLKNAPLLLLDEPTAGLDMETECLIMEAIWELARGRTALLLTHRLKGLERVDRILVMAEGKIVQQGPWSALSKIDGELRRLVTRGT